ncbi:MAG: hypothetical protein RIA64_09595 [Rhodospirillales bacterium]
MPEISVNGETLHYRRGGSGPTLLMLHSLGTNGYLWEGQMAALQDRLPASPWMRAVTADRPTTAA